jgi:hypothetical protein
MLFQWWAHPDLRITLGWDLSALAYILSARGFAVGVWPYSNYNRTLVINLWFLSWLVLSCAYYTLGWETKVLFFVWLVLGVALRWDRKDFW